MKNRVIKYLLSAQMYFFITIGTLSFLFLNRFLIPDIAYDTINYHLFTGQRGLTHPLLPFTQAEFYPSGIFTFVPFHDTILYIASQTLGYRLGPIVNLFCFFGLIYYFYASVKLFYPDYLKKTDRLLSFALLFSGTMVLELLLEIATYYIEIPNTFLMVAGFFYIARYFINDPIPQKSFIIGNLLIGLALFGKMINVIYVCPLLLFYFIYYARQFQRKRLSKTQLKAGLIACLVLVGPFSLYMIANYLQTGNPLYPFFNGVFKSQFYADLSFSNSFWGGSNIVEKIFWPLYSIVQPTRLGELHHLITDYKLQFYWLISVACGIALYRRKDIPKFEKIIVIFFLLSTFEWSILFGYLRYATVLEILGAWSVIILFYRKVFLFRIPLFSIIIVIFLIFQTARVIRVNLVLDDSFRPSVLVNHSLHKSQLPYLFSRSIPLPQQVQQADIVVNCVHPSASYYALTDLKNKPMILLDTISGAGFLDNQAYTTEVNKRLRIVTNKSAMLSFIAIVAKDGPHNIYEQCKANLIKHHAIITDEIRLNNFLGHPTLTLLLIKGLIVPPFYENYK